VADLYETLGVSKTATQEEIRKAYRTLARKYHPDANPDDPKAEDRFKEVSHAHDVLSDPEKRREYDLGQSMFGGRGGPRPGGGGGPAGGAGFGDFADIFSTIFKGGGRGGGSARANPARRGDDVEVMVNLSFDQAMNGAVVPITVDKEEVCERCKGSGAKPGTNPRLCPECNGRGVRGRDLGSFALSEPCPRCHGNGTVVDDPCEVCGGAGSTRRQVKYNVKIPAGAKDRSQVRLKGKGEAGVRGGPSGDLLVRVHVTPSRVFTRQGDDLAIDVPVTFAEAALGARIEVPTVDGRIALTVPAGSENGRALRLRGQGAPRPNGGGRGDLIARLRVQVPAELTREQRDALEQFAKLDDGKDPREALFS
jgi:molecular chaperone DnaJ